MSEIAPQPRSRGRLREVGAADSGAPVPPIAVEAEEHLLGALLLAGASGPEASIRTVERVRATGLAVSDFYGKRNGYVYRAIQALAERQQPTDLLLVADELRGRGELDEVGGTARLHALAQYTPAFANAPHYADFVRTTARRRLEWTIGLALTSEAETAGGLAGNPELVEQLQILLNPARPSNEHAPLDLAALLAGPVPETEWLVDGWIARSDVAAIVGDPGTGKSILALVMADAIRRGSSFLGAACAKGRVGIVDLENPLPEVHKRLRRVGLTADNHDGLVVFHQIPVNLYQRAGVAWVRKVMDEHSLDVLILDSFRRIAPDVDENDSAAIAGFFSPLRALTAQDGRVVAVIHHSRKRQADAPSDPGQMVRGSGDFLASVDSLLYLRRKESGVFTLEHGKARRGLVHDPITVRISSAEDERLKLINEGVAAMAEDKVEILLNQIKRTLHEEGGPLERQVLALRVNSASSDRTFQRALTLGYDRGLLAKTPQGVGKPTLYALKIEPPQ